MRMEMCMPLPPCLPARLRVLASAMNHNDWHYPQSSLTSSSGNEVYALALLHLSHV